MVVPRDQSCSIICRHTKLVHTTLQRDQRGKKVQRPQSYLRFANMYVSRSRGIMYSSKSDICAKPPEPATWNLKVLRIPFLVEHGTSTTYHLLA